jgi:hypothetical protein
MSAALILILVLLTGSAAGSAPARVYHGAPALGQRPDVAAVLYVRAGAAPHSIDLTLAENAASSGTAIRAYDLDMTKRMHLVVIGSDFRYFAHLHPELVGDGRFRLHVQLPYDGLFYFYADGEPAGFGDRIFRFDVAVGSNARKPYAPIARVPRSQAGPYTLTLSTNSLVAGRPAAVLVHVVKNGAPARDLHPFLGAVAHAIFINAKTLDYVHVHPTSAGGAMAGTMSMTGSGSMSGMAALPASSSVAPDAVIHVVLPSPGTYRLWYQFAGGSQMYVAQFAMVAR